MKKTEGIIAILVLALLVLGLASPTKAEIFFRSVLPLLAPLVLGAFVKAKSQKG